MIIKISDKTTHDFAFRLTAEMLEAYGNELEGQPDSGGISVEGVIRRKDSETVSLKMHLNGRLLFPCARCLRPVPVQISFDDEDDYELAEGQDTVDLLPFVEECLYIHEPYRVLCSETCKGLCPDCGANLNEEQCRCGDRIEVDPRLEKLKALLDDENMNRRCDHGCTET